MRETHWKSSAREAWPVSLEENADLLAARAGSGFRVTPSARDAHRVEIWDVMPVGWLGNFTRAMSSVGIDIVRGLARRGEHARWSAEFEVRATGGWDVRYVDFLALAHERSREFAVQALELQSFELERSEQGRHALVLRVEARDRTGFLASLLELLAGFVLFPEELTIDTLLDEARDVLWLSSVGGESPAPGLEAALRAALQACTRPRRPGSLFPST